MKAGFVSTRNACKLCAPLGASLAFRGIEGCIPLIHGSQGCSTYIRRYVISHFREPIDIASSNFTESSAIFGGGDNLKAALENITRQYKPLAIGITSTCLSETIGENIPMYLSQYRAGLARAADAVSDATTVSDTPVIFYASTPSYKGTHMDGFHEAVYSAVTALAGTMFAGTETRDSGVSEAQAGGINVLSGFVSAEDLRELHEVLSSFGLPYTLLPDYSETLDGASWDTYQKLSEGGTPIDAIRVMHLARATLALGESIPEAKHAGLWLERTHDVPSHTLPLPIGIEASDRFFAKLSEISGTPIPKKWEAARGRLVDAYIDGHKYCSGKQAIVYGERDFVDALSAFLREIGITPVIAGTGADGEDSTDFEGMLTRARELEKENGRAADFVIGNSKGLYLARNLGLPLVRCGFPVHDRMGGHRILHLGYRGTMNLFDRVCNALMEAKQNAVASGYTYI